MRPVISIMVTKSMATRWHLDVIAQGSGKRRRLVASSHAETLPEALRRLAASVEAHESELFASPE